jgi:small-conductance mechanosensitive channel
MLLMENLITLEINTLSPWLSAPLTILMCYVIQRIIFLVVKRNVSDAPTRLTIYALSNAIIIPLGFIIVSYILTNQFGAIFSSLGIISAALVVALQNFVSSFFGYIYIGLSKMFRVGDIIKTGNVLLPVVGEVQRVNVFYTLIKEMDDRLFFTGKTVHFPNNYIFSYGIFNFTRDNLLFWYEFSYTLDYKQEGNLEAFDQVIEEVFTDMHKKHEIYFANTNVDNIPSPKITYSIDTMGIQAKVRCMAHFNYVNRMNNKFMGKVLEAHKNGIIKLLFTPINTESNVH